MSAQENLWLYSLIKLPHVQCYLRALKWSNNNEEALQRCPAQIQIWSNTSGEHCISSKSPWPFLGCFCPPQHLFPMFQHLPAISGRDIPKVRSEPNVTSFDTCGTCRGVQHGPCVHGKEKFHGRTEVLGCEGLQGTSWCWCSYFGSGGSAGCWYLWLKGSQWEGLCLGNIFKLCFGHIRAICGQPPGDARGRPPLLLFGQKG